MRALVVGNWKMHGREKDLARLPHLARVLAENGPIGAEVVICPPFTLLREAKALSQGVFGLGGQDCSGHPEGAFTGEISAPMLRDCGASHVILGHSERRCAQRESDSCVQAKIIAALETGLVPIVCFGETQQQRAQGLAIETVQRQVQASVPLLAGQSLVAAYEPIWAIGSGQTPDAAQIAQMHAAIAEGLQDKGFGGAPRVLYGGSVRPGNAAELLATDGVDGLLVGAASLENAAFLAIIERANALAR